jgi:hypothetical protein
MNYAATIAETLKTKDDFNEEVDFLEPILVLIHMALTQVPFLNILVALQLLTYGALYLILLRKNLIKRRK